MRKIALFVISLSILLAGCSQENYEQSTTQKKLTTGVTKVAESKQEVWQQVTVKHYDFEGGFFGLVSNSGEKLLPMNLAKKYKIAGTTLKIRGHTIKSMMTIQQWGTAFEIIEVELIKLGKGHEKNKGIEY
ncbi:MAG: hypothetical protein GY928_02475 [Colwellia sp.]|nr:hypothetical protein [Colwellia sp.]